MPVISQNAVQGVLIEDGSSSGEDDGDGDDPSSAPLGPGEVAPSPYEGEKVTFLEFILHEHSILSLCFAKEGRGIEVPCCICCTTCCCIELEETYSIRQRIFVFLLVLMACTWVSIDVVEWHHGFWWTFALTTCVLMPLTCWLKRAVPTIRKRLMKYGGWLCPIFVGACVLAFGGYSIYMEVIATMGERKGMKTLKKTLKTLGLQMALEFPTLVYKYFCCSVCCSCCLPERTTVRGSSAFF